MGSPQCFENPPTLNSTCGAGTVEEIGGLSCYLSLSLTTRPSHSNLAILLISDVFGYEAPNLRKLADKIAAAGYLVVVPDFFYGDYVRLDPDFDRQAWKKIHNKEKGCEDAKTVIAALKGKGVTSIGAAGFCWGGNVVVKLAQSVDYIQAGVVLHPGVLTADDFNEVEEPLLLLGAEFDKSSPPEQMKQFGEILSAKSGIESFVKIFPGVHHGWSVRYSEEDESAVKSAEEAHSDMLNWFNKFVK